MTHNIDLLLVNPSGKKKVYGSLGSSLSGIEPPLWCGLMAAFIRDRGYSVRIIDAEAEDISPEQIAKKIELERPLLVDILVMGINPSASSTPKMTAVRETVRALKEISPCIKILLSGLHPSALPERTLREEDVSFVCVGEGFYTILQLIETLKSNENNYKIAGLWYKENGEIKANLPAALIENLDDIPNVAWDLLPMDKYRAHNWHCFSHIDQRQPYAAIYTSVGCPYKCTYCNIHAFYNDKPGIRYRSPEKVIEEIDLLVKKYKIKNLKIVDELFVLKKERVARICDLIIDGGYDLNIWCYARVDTVSEPILRKMKQAGFNWLCFGFESASRKVLSGVAKRVEDNIAKNAIDMTKAAGIYILANFMFGLPSDNLDTMQETLNMAKEHNFEYVNFYTVMAYPGSQLYIDALRQNIKLPKEWHGYSQFSEDTLPLPTKYLSAEDVLYFRDKAFKEYYKNPEYLEMIREKFGPKVVDHIEDMLKNEIHRQILAK